MKPLTVRRIMKLVAVLAVAVAAIGFLDRRFNPPRIHTRRMQCMSNIRQLGLGILGYAYQHHDHFPPGTIPNPDLPLERRLGWGVTILPFIDEVEYLNERGLTFDQAEKLAWDDPVFADLGAKAPGITHCWTSDQPASYLVIAGLGADSPSVPKSDRRAGIFGDDRRVTIADIKDGTSTTMMLAESSLVPGPWFAGGRITVRGLDPARPPYIGPNGQFGGNHPGGASVLFADGSARFISDTIDPKVFEALSTMAGGEKLSADFAD